ncbi:MAG: hypothetical protein IPM39_27700 [Chloroflexi bacterium]|nr:hypothetical protein [Chloroflexota bacterium]MBK8989802.1 hypothetical protein [Chloroflexota bacterium]
MFVQIVIVTFILLEFSNVLALYFAPSSRYANAVGVFTAWDKSEQYPEIHEFVNYLVNWIAGTKLIFLSLLAIIVLYADAELQRLSLWVLALTTASFYWRLFPLIRNMGRNGQVEPRNYATTLGVMILVFIAAFVSAAIF